MIEAVKTIVLLSEIFLIASVVTYLTIPFVRALAVRNGLYDTNSSRKIHRGKIPRLGGVAIFGSYLFSLVLFHMSAKNGGTSIVGELPWTMLPSAVIIFLLGLYDDVFGIRSYRKLIVQIVAGVCAFAVGFRIETLHLFGTTFDFGLGSVFITVAWIIFVTNAYNLIDGMDGLAGGLGVIALTAISFFSVLHGDAGLTLTAFVLAGTLLGFLPHNFSPATIFMGDAGSYFVGFVLSILSINVLSLPGESVSVLVPLLILAIPLFDTLLAISRRFLKHVHDIAREEQLQISLTCVARRILSADSEHIHHILLRRGLSQQQVAVRLYWVAAALSLVAMIVPYAGPVGEIACVFVVGSLMLLAALQLGLQKYIAALVKRRYIESDQQSLPTIPARKVANR